jgi:hypothetical protein
VAANQLSHDDSSASFSATKRQARRIVDGGLRRGALALAAAGGAMPEAGLLGLEPRDRLRDFVLPREVDVKWTSERR